MPSALPSNAPSDLITTPRSRTVGRLVLLPTTLPGLWMVACLAAILALTLLNRIPPNDFWWHARVGRWIVEQGAVPRVDLFTFTRAGAPWQYQSWLMEVALYALFQRGGAPLVVLANGLAIGAAYAVILSLAFRVSGGDRRLAALMTLAAGATGASNWTVRPQTISVLLFACFLYILVTHEEASNRPARRLLWVLPPLTLLWANAHGGFVFGLGLVAATVVTELVAWRLGRRPFPRVLLVVAALCVLALFATPSGPGMVDYVLGFLRHPVTQSINQEFMPPTVRDGTGVLLFLLIAGLVTALVARRHRPSLGHALRLFLFGALALTAVRNVIWFGMVAAPVLAECLRKERGVRAAPQVGHRRMNQALGGLSMLMALLSAPWFRPYLPLPEEWQGLYSLDTPTGAAEYLATVQPTPRPFHSEGYGSYLIWATDVPVFIDTRFELYPEEHWEDYLAVSYARYDWQEILGRYGVDTLVLDREQHAPLIGAVEVSEAWSLRYEDGISLIYTQRQVRTTPEGE